MKYLYVGLFICTSVLAQNDFDKTEELFNVSLKSGKEESTRRYFGTTSREIPSSLASVKESILKFSERCNDSLRDKRKYLSETQNCRFHSEHDIETFVVKEHKTEDAETYLLGRRTYNKGLSEFYEMIQLKEGKDSSGKTVVTFSSSMLNDEEVKLLTDIKMSKDSVYDKTEATIVLTEVSDSETSLKMDFKSETSHWLLNKEMMVPQVFVAISKNINEFISTLSDKPSRDIASK